MHTCIHQKLRLGFKKSGLSYQQVADLMGLCKASIFRKLSGELPLKVEEALKMGKILNVEITAKMK